MQRAKAIFIEHTTIRDVVLVIGASFIISLLSKVAIPLWFTPIPLVLQNSALLVTSVLLGARRGALAVFLVLVQAAAGLPVLSGGVGLAAFWGPTGGYRIGYLIAAYVVGALSERKRTLATAFLAMMAGSGIILLCGVSYLATFIGFKQAVMLGAVPFLLGDLLKVLAGLNVLQWLRWTRVKYRGAV